MRQIAQQVTEEMTRNEDGLQKQKVDSWQEKTSGRAKRNYSEIRKKDKKDTSKATV